MISDSLRSQTPGVPDGDADSTPVDTRPQTAEGRVVLGLWLAVAFVSGVLLLTVPWYVIEAVRLLVGDF